MKRVNKLSVHYHEQKVGESIRIPRKKGWKIIRQMAEQCGEILSDDYKDCLKKAEP